MGKFCKWKHGMYSIHFENLKLTNSFVNFVGFWKAQAWITSAVTDQSVPAALVLAESIRKTKTSFRIAVLTSLDVSSDNRYWKFLNHNMKYYSRLFICLIFVLIFAVRLWNELLTLCFWWKVAMSQKILLAVNTEVLLQRRILLIWCILINAFMSLQTRW